MREIKRKILRSGYNQREFSEKTGLSYQLVINATSGKHSPGCLTCLKIMYASGGAINLEDFLSDQILEEFKEWKAQIDAAGGRQKK